MLHPQTHGKMEIDQVTWQRGAEDIGERVQVVSQLPLRWEMSLDCPGEPVTTSGPSKGAQKSQNQRHGIKKKAQLSGAGLTSHRASEVRGHGPRTVRGPRNWNR